MGVCEMSAKVERADETGPRERRELKDTKKTTKATWGQPVCLITPRQLCLHHLNPRNTYTREQAAQSHAASNMWRRRQINVFCGEMMEFRSSGRIFSGFPHQQHINHLQECTAVPQDQKFTTVQYHFTNISTICSYSAKFRRSDSMICEIHKIS